MHFDEYALVMTFYCNVLVLRGKKLIKSNTRKFAEKR